MNWQQKHAANMILEAPMEAGSGRSDSSAGSGRKQKARNPFKIPDDRELLAYREMEKQKKEQTKHNLSTMRVENRIESSSRQTFRNMTKVDTAPVSAEEEALAQLILSPDSNQVQEGLRDFIAQKREIFLAQLAIDTKKEELKRLEALEGAEEEALAKKESEINVFREQFRSFLESDGKATMEARRAAEVKSKQRIEVSMQIKQISSQISSLRNEIAHHDEKLQECEEYKQFLENLTPSDWRKKHTDSNEMYFKDPKQLLEIMENLEEQNKFLMRHCQEAEETVERYRTRFNNLLEERDGSIAEMLTEKKEKEKVLKTMNAKNSRYRTNGDFHFGNELSEAELRELQEAISNFHRSLGFEAAATNDTESMLRRIEDKMEALTQKLDGIDQEVVKQKAQEKSRKRRELERQEKQKQKEKEQEEKTQRMLALATNPIKRKTGRPLIPRSLPERKMSREKIEEQARQEQAQAKADQDLLFGAIWD